MSHICHSVDSSAYEESRIDKMLFIINIEREKYKREDTNTGIYLNELNLRINSSIVTFCKFVSKSNPVDLALRFGLQEFLRRMVSLVM
ncbi:hypothetical protein ALC53_13402 [Atta colombica]|uniref:Uncharacterized protein n=1 Tax=Atta colombica TaxID=520822 RepID=A0A195AWG3_9HYME|nr:hypothetical protein ALC53_13402 [Atta colombica]